MEKDPTLVAALESLVNPDTRGGPMSPLGWICKNTRELAQTLTRQVHRVSHRAVGELLRVADHSLQANAKWLEGAGRPDRDARPRYIKKVVKPFLAEGLCVVSVDSRQKELVGPFYNWGREWQPRGEPDVVRVHVFPDSKLGKAIQ